MDEPPELQHLAHWRMAVWALRVGFAGLALVIVGLIVLSAGSTPWVLALGVIIWLAAAAVTLSGVIRGPQRAARATPRMVVAAVHAHPRHGPRAVGRDAALELVADEPSEDGLELWRERER